jgi:hypothetical protein
MPGSLEIEYTQEPRRVNIAIIKFVKKTTLVVKILKISKTI